MFLVTLQLNSLKNHVKLVVNFFHELQQFGCLHFVSSLVLPQIVVGSALTGLTDGIVKTSGGI